MGLSKQQQCDKYRRSYLNYPGRVFRTKHVQKVIEGTHGQAVAVLDKLRDMSEVSQLSEHVWRANRPSRDLICRMWV